ncbi:hypothetical protein BDV25DRAFT_145818 [Aspergillus avenaceus]|uniref:SAM domain-containing protein n=1 Tax=Aspergillus avenaceus TaxID=36643 RepID=A0A5N6TCZ4_ASPAV|nr:hypothetical protein BDV25DRAFT_145818 [Aspergillus avenaceus]
MPASSHTHLVEQQVSRTTSVSAVASNDMASSQSAASESLCQQIKKWDENECLSWVQEKLDVRLKDDNIKKFLDAEINGSAFLDCAGKPEWFERAGITLGPSANLAKLGQSIVDGSTTITGAFPNGLNYHPPSPRMLLATQGKSWEYQPSRKLRNELRDAVYKHHQAYSRGEFDKKTIPLYLFLSGSGTGKSRNASELHILARQCFDGTRFDDDDDRTDFKEDREIADRLTDPYVFHVSLENATSLGKEEESWTGIGSRMLLQLHPEDKGEKMTVSKLNKLFTPPTPEEVISRLEVAEPVDALKRKALILVVDGLRALNEDRNDLYDIVTKLGNLAHGGFFLICGTSTISGPVSRAMKVSQRWSVYLSCEPIETPRMADGQAVFKHQNLLAQVLIKDCGGHGRALEILLQYMDKIQKDPSNVSSFIDHLSSIYASMVPTEKDALAIIKSVMGNGALARDAILPGGHSTPDDVSARGLIRFPLINQNEDKPRGKFEIPYMWILCLCSCHENHTFFRELQLFDYHQFACMDNPIQPGNSSHDSLEKIILQVRKIKSLMFAEAECVTIAKLHHGGMMTESTGGISFINHHLKGDIATKQIPSKTTTENREEWMVQTGEHGDIDLRKCDFILLNKSGASAGDAVLCLDSETPRTEAHQYKYWANGPGINFQKERDKAVSGEDIFVLVSTAPSIRSLGNEIPDRCVVVLGENWQSYFGPYAARSYLVAKSAKKRKIDQVDP